MKTRVEQIIGRELGNIHHVDLVNKVILPEIVRPTGQDIRGWRISDSFMNLMADFGQDFYARDRFTGEILLEIAMQRISCGAVLHEQTSIKLPFGYENFSVAKDQWGLMSEGCWAFIQKQATFCLQAKKVKFHMKTILFGLLDHIDGDTTLNGYMLGSYDSQLKPKNVYQFAWSVLAANVSFEERYEHFATPERYKKYAGFFKENWSKIDKSNFFAKIGITGFFAKRKVTKEILNS